MNAIVDTIHASGEALLEDLRYVNGRQNLLSGRARLSLYRRLNRFAARGFDSKVPLEDMLLRAKERRRSTVPVLEEWLRGINDGQRFSDLVGAHIPTAERMAIASSEDNGREADGFAMAAYIFESRTALRNALLGGLAYPAVLCILFAALLVFVSFLLIPTLESMYPVESWPPVSAALYYLSMGVRSYGLPVALALIALLVTAIATLPAWVSGWRLRLDHWLPPWTIYREVQSGMFLVALSSVVQAGAPIDEAIRLLKRSASPWLCHHLDLSTRGIAEGKRPALAMNTGLMGEALMDDLLAYDRAGALTDAILLLGKESVGIVVDRLKSISSLIGALMMILVAIGLAWAWGSFVLVFIAMRSGFQGV